MGDHDILVELGAHSGSETPDNETVGLFPDLIYKVDVTQTRRFTAFYGGQHSGRKLNWLFHMSKGELVTNCFKNK